jgi:hypothetical protein
MSIDPITTAILSGPCAYCAGYHTGVCPRIESIDYHPDGTVAHVKLRPPLPTFQCPNAPNPCNCTGACRNGGVQPPSHSWGGVTAPPTAREIAREVIRGQEFCDTCHRQQIDCVCP